MQRLKRVHVEISNICNLKCSFCPEVQKDRRTMSPAEFAHVASQVATLADEVALHLLGEPLNHPELDAILAACATHALPANIVTNGVLLSGPRVDLLLLPIVRQVSFSLQSFADNFPDRDPQPYLRRIKSFVDRAARERPDLYINLRFWDLDGHGAADTGRNTALRRATAAEFGFSWDAVRVDLRRRKSHRLDGRLYLHFDSRFEWPSLAQPPRATRGFCHGLTGHAGIHADGTVVPCCLDRDAIMPLGNALTQPLREILDGPRARHIREGFAAGELREPLCQSCTYIARFKTPGLP